MKNIVFIGMPGCGKTTVSKRVASMLDREWHDSDLEIENSAQMAIANIFALRGEEHFRKLETECIEQLMNTEHKDGVVIAVGGGAVLRNGEILRKDSTVIYLYRSVEDIAETLEEGTRPLSKSVEELRALYGQRHEIYEQISHITIVNDGTVEETVNKVLEELK